MKLSSRKLGQLLVSAGVLTSDDLDRASLSMQGSGLTLEEHLLHEGVLTETSLVQGVAASLGVPYVDLSETAVDRDVASMIPESTATAHFVLPVRFDGTTITLAVADPLDYQVANDVQVYTGYRIEVVAAERSRIEERIREAYASNKALRAVEEFGSDLAAMDMNGAGEEEDSEQPIIRLVNTMIEQAVQLRASDIHIEPLEHAMRIRFRVDGALATYMETAPNLVAPVVSRIKFIGGMNIAEKRSPQDGRITQKVAGREVDLRISVLPTVFGEKVVIRITTLLGSALGLDAIGFLPETLERFNGLLKKPHGIILMTGPTGSGKSTTLYSALSDIHRDDVNIITIENPVEMILEGITQVEVNPKAGLTFASTLRSVLRQDPDIVMIGEIRDPETAEIATSVAITGHLVFSTLHTYDAPSAIARLIDMGIAPFMVTSAIVGVMAQRLMRRICTRCREPYLADAADLAALEMPLDSNVTLYRGAGCEFCNGSGYRGRIAVHELMVMSPEIRRGVHEGLSGDSLREIAEQHGMIPLSENARRIVLDGTTTLAEMLKIYVSTTE